MSTHSTDSSGWIVTGRTSQGTVITGRVTHLRGERLVFESGDPQLVLRLSEVFEPFKITTQAGDLTGGRAVVTNAVAHGLGWLCEVRLADAWSQGQPSVPKAQFADFLRAWQNQYTVRQEFKVVVADLHSLLSHLREWLERVELGLAQAAPGERRAAELAIIQQLDEPLVRAVNVLHERFEAITGRLEADEHPAHQDFCRRLLHPLFLCSPFGHRTYAKPLGYAGDYEMVNMIMRSPYEGPSLYAQAVNVWLLRQYPSQAHRNRIRYLTEKLVAETVRVSLQQRPARVLNLGCGPAHEIQAFLRESAASDLAELTLLDFNQETIEHTRRILERGRKEAGRQTRLHYHKKSVVGLLKEAARATEGGAAPSYDFIYCAGLFDYLPDRTCQQLLSAFWQWLAPGGLMVATNVYPCQPFRQMLEYLLDWRLIYRDPAQMDSLAPAAAGPGQSRTVSDLTGTNLFLEARKPQ